jgi:2-dehydro-3-deoxy-D-arabinonate dehydratase
MRLVKYTFERDETPRVGLLDQDRLRPLGGGPFRLSELLHADDPAGAGP